jgi:hypothetical protein
MLQLWVDFTSRKCRADLDDIHRELMRLQQILISTVLIYDQMLASRYSMINGPASENLLDCQVARTVFGLPTAGVACRSSTSGNLPD